MPPIRLVVLAPGHFHAALIQKRMIPGVDPRVAVYAPPGGDLDAYLDRIRAFNSRPDDPTSWSLDVHAWGDWLDRFSAERPGDVAIISGRNRWKIDAIERAVAVGMHVLADKPWIIAPADFPRLERVLETAERNGSIVYDVMTERFEITSILQRDLVNDADVFGVLDAGSPDDPAVVLQSVHHLKKDVAGVPLRRPVWFFDTQEQGEALADVGTHLVDQVLWMGFTEPSPRTPNDLRIVSAERWPTRLDRDQFAAITGESGEGGYDGNNRLLCQIRGVFVRFEVIWDYEAPPGGGDTHYARFRGSNATVEIRQEPRGHPELFVVLRDSQPAIRDALETKIAAWQRRYPGIALNGTRNEFRISIPDAYRAGHEAHFAEVATRFLAYVESRSQMPAWETPIALAKYWLTTHGVAAARDR